MLTMDDIQAIVRLIERGESDERIAKKLKMSPVLVADVREEHKRQGG